MKKNQDICEEEQETEVTRVKRYYKATVIGSIELKQEEMTDQWNRTESPETNPHKYMEIIYDRVGNVNQ